MTLRLKPPSQSPEEWIREADQRMKRLERSRTSRAGDWVLTQNDAGVPVLVKPGAAMALDGSELDPNTLEVATRGFVTSSDVALAVSAGTTKDLNAATVKQIDDGTATGNAQYTADNANAVAAALEARLNAGTTGYSFTDSFDADEPTDLGSEWFRTTFGSGGGVYRTDGTGLAHQTIAGGATPMEWIDRHVTATNTLNQTVTTILNAVPAPAGGIGTVPARHTVMACMDATNGDRIEGRVENGNCAIGYSIANSYTQIDARSISMVDGDRWDMVIDSTTHAFILLRNNLPALRFDDVGHAYPLDASHMFGGFGSLAGTYVVLWWTAQSSAPPVQSFNLSDRV